jgi:hypothetical protein
MTPSLKRLCTCLLLAAGLATPAYPWGKQGHEALALVAGQNMNAEARRHVIKILGNDDISSIAVWMDELRSAFFHTGPLATDPDALKFNAEFPKNGQWHYVDLPLGTKEYELDGAFSNPDDVVHKAEDAVVILEGGGDKRITKREALYMLVHFVGDEHQPLHVGNGFYKFGADGSAQLVTDPAEAKDLPNDKGGNALFFGPDRYDELHGYWDFGMVEKIVHSEGVAELGAALQTQVAAAGDTWKSTGDYHHWPEQWATQSLVAARTAYEGITFGAVTPDPKGGFKKIAITLPAGYDKKCIPIAETRLSQAAYHLTEILNAIKWAD